MMQVEWAWHVSTIALANLSAVFSFLNTINALRLAHDRLICLSCVDTVSYRAILTAAAKVTHVRKRATKMKNSVEDMLSRIVESNSRDSKMEMQGSVYCSSSGGTLSIK